MWRKAIDSRESFTKQEKNCLKEAQEYFRGISHTEIDPDNDDIQYEACAFIVYRNGHYNIGVEIHTNNRNPKGQVLIDESEFKGMVTVLQYDPFDGKYYRKSKSFSNDFKEWNTVAVSKEDLDRVIDIMKEHVYHLTLVDPEWSYPPIDIETKLDVIVDIEGYPGNAGEAPDIEQLKEYAEQTKSRYMLGSDGVYYSSSGYPLTIESDYVPSPGSSDLGSVLFALVYLHPEGKFAVDIQSWADYPDYLDEEIRPFMDTHNISNGMTYTEFWKAWFAVAQYGPQSEDESKKLKELEQYLPEMQQAVDVYIKEEYLPDVRRQEAEKLSAYGIEFDSSIDGSFYKNNRNEICIMTAGQVLNFLGCDKCGYFLGLAPYAGNSDHFGNS